MKKILVALTLFMSCFIFMSHVEAENIISYNSDRIIKLADTADLSDIDPTVEGCSIFSSDLIEFMQTVLDYIRIIGITLTVIYGILDYVKAIFGSDDKAMSKANKDMKNRLIAVALLFLVPVILNFALGLFGEYANGTCGVE